VNFWVFSQFLRPEKYFFAISFLFSMLLVYFQHIWKVSLKKLYKNKNERVI